MTIQINKSNKIVKKLVKYESQVKSIKAKTSNLK